ncbi:hypothetical protein LEP1GSC060_3036 [Leptospira weilii serovar Ranarum str. ICFT]|uniref:Uncharacterized protein n=1 Tax=Leptospira weilii serovar Ranarum str. ICFT TaxID=1218598 RepID=N1WJQ4_9LEPT|nr:hypothetical protein LEP1GSC060_3036 [Leptospira weilii serovar Ranarum str. ICFT]
MSTEIDRFSKLTFSTNFPARTKTSDLDIFKARSIECAGLNDPIV